MAGRKAAAAASLVFLALTLSGCRSKHEDSVMTLDSTQEQATPVSNSTSRAGTAYYDMPADTPDEIPGTTKRVAFGDEIFLRSHTGLYLDVEGISVQARFTDQGPPGGSQSFIIQGSGTGDGFVRSGDAVYLLAGTGQRLGVSGSFVHAERDFASGFQSFVIEKPSGGQIFTGDAVRLRAHTGRYVNVAGSSVQAWSLDGDGCLFIIEERGFGMETTTSSSVASSHPGVDAGNVTTTSNLSTFASTSTSIAQTVASTTTITLAASTTSVAATTEEVPPTGRSTTATWSSTTTIADSSPPWSTITSSSSVTLPQSAMPEISTTTITATSASSAGTQPPNAVATATSTTTQTTAPSSVTVTGVISTSTTSVTTIAGTTEIATSATTATSTATAVSSTVTTPDSSPTVTGLTSTTTTTVAEIEKVNSTITTTVTAVASSTTTAWTPPSAKFEAARNCYLEAPLKTGFGCKRLAVLEGAQFSKNEFGQETTGKHRCFEELRRAGGNSFVFDVGHCELWNCSSNSALKASANPERGPPKNNKISLLSFHGKYLSADSLGNLRVTSTDEEDPWTIFSRIDNPDGTISLQSQGGLYVSSELDGGMLANRDVPDLWEQFSLVQNLDGTISLKSYHGRYVTAHPEGYVAAQAVAIDDWEKFQLIPHSSGEQVSDDAAASVNLTANASIYSTLCRYQEVLGGRGGEERRAPVFVKLWEWNYVDIARECQDYLGPNGFDAVQVSPVVEHILGPHWWTRYQPISFGLNTRSGSAAEFQAMVATCRAAGVEVIVDLVINHIASPCQEATDAGHTAVTPCTGWNGSSYGFRRTAGARGWDASTPDDFHHQSWSDLQNCGVSAPSFLCGSPDIRDCSCCPCDLYGLPDWNTGLQRVQAMHYRHLQELHSMGVTMLRIDASLYMSVDDIAPVINSFPWDYIYQEWWGEWPVADRTRYLGNMRDVAYRWKIAHSLAMEQDLATLPDLLELSWGTNGVHPEDAVYPIAFHDGRANDANPDVPTYKNGLEFHQQQKFMLAWPKSSVVLLWGGFGWENTEQGPPGCEEGDTTCAPMPVFDDVGSPRCMPTPQQSPLPAEEISSRSWVCEHRWAGVAGLVGFRKACGGLPVSQVTDGQAEAGSGRLAFRIGSDCFVALVRGHNTRWPKPWGALGDWSLAGLRIGLPKGRYCDVASLPTLQGWDGRSCPREVGVDENGMVLEGVAAEGDLLAIHAGARLPEDGDGVGGGGAAKRRLRAAPPRG